MTEQDGLPDLSKRTVVHLCIDMQRMFAEDTEWNTPWMERVLPETLRIAQAHPAETIFSRFIPPRRATDTKGAWRLYFERWHEFTLDEMDPGLIELVEPLAALVPPATVIDKPGYSPFHVTDLDNMLKERGVDTIVVTGAETDVCVLAAVFSAIDLGYSVILPKDALCSSADETHDALITVYGSRFSQQIFLTETAVLLEAWPASG